MRFSDTSPRAARDLWEVRQKMEIRKNAGALKTIAGIGEDRGAYGRDHDRFLYSKPRKRR